MPTGAEAVRRATGQRQHVSTNSSSTGPVLHGHLEQNLPTAGDYQVVAVGTDNVNNASGVSASIPVTVSSPVVTTGAANPVGSSTATLNGSVNAEGDTDTVKLLRHDAIPCHDVLGRHRRLGQPGDRQWHVEHPGERVADGLERHLLLQHRSDELGWGHLLRHAAELHDLGHRLQDDRGDIHPDGPGARDVVRIHHGRRRWRWRQQQLRGHQRHCRWRRWQVTGTITIPDSSSATTFTVVVGGGGGGGASTGNNAGGGAAGPVAQVVLREESAAAATSTPLVRAAARRASTCRERRQAPSLRWPAAAVAVATASTAATGAAVRPRASAARARDRAAPAAPVSTVAPASAATP